MSRSAAIRSRSRATGPTSHSRTVCAPRPGRPRRRCTASSTTTCATRQASVAASSACTSSIAAGSPTSPLPSPYQLCSRIRSRSSSSRRPSAECGEGSAACSTRSSVSSAASRSSRGGRTGVDPAHQGAGPLAPLEGQLRRAVLERQPHALERQRPAVADQGALEVQAAERRLPGVQVGEPGADVVAGVAAVAARAGQVRSAPRASSSRVATGESSATRTRAMRSRAPASSPRRIASRAAWSWHDRGVAPMPVVLAGRASCVRAALQRERRRPSPISARTTTRVGAERLHLAARAAEAPGRAPRHRRRPRRVLAQQRPGEGQLALGLEAAQPAGAVRRGRRSRAETASWARPAAVSTSARSCSPTARLTAERGASTGRAASMACSAPTRSPVSSRA